MSDTPETDAFIRGLNHWVKTAYTLENFARKLERERDEAERGRVMKHDRLTSAEVELSFSKQALADLTRERDEARRIAEDWREDARIASGVLHGSAQATEKFPWER